MTSNVKSDRKIIAHYKSGRMIFVSVVIIVFFTVGIFVVGYGISLEGGVIALAENRPMLAMAYFIIVISAGVFYWLAALILARIVFEDARAIWIENGTLVALHKINFTALCKDVRNIQKSTYRVSGKYAEKPCIAVTMRDGTVKNIATDPVIESPDVIIQKMKLLIPHTV
jgi:hypothetical protein